jgi:hypothetical protein
MAALARCALVAVSAYSYIGRDNAVEVGEPEAEGHRSPLGPLREASTRSA